MSNILLLPTNTKLLTVRETLELARSVPKSMTTTFSYARRRPPRPVWPPPSAPPAYPPPLTPPPPASPVCSNPCFDTTCYSFRNEDCSVTEGFRNSIPGSGCDCTGCCVSSGRRLSANQPPFLPPYSPPTPSFDLSVLVKGPKGSLDINVHKDMNLDITDNVLVVSRPSDNRIHRSLHGTTRMMIMNSVTGVSDGFVNVAV